MSECTATELAQLLYWLMCVGWSMRQLEVRMDMRASLLDAAAPPDPPAGGGEPPPPLLPPAK